MYVFNSRFGQYGLIDNYWTIESTPLKLKSNTEYNLYLTKTIKKKLNLRNNCVEDAEVLKTGYNHMKCIEAYMVNFLKKKFTENNMKICWIPQADYFIKQMNETQINACQTRAEMKFVKKALLNVMSFADSNIPECLPPCTIEEVDVKQQGSPIPSSNSSETELFIYWDTFEVLCLTLMQLFLLLEVLCVYFLDFLA